ncbi:unnamed protein product [Rangifer tarandus platyrhynchus]|uniref:Uncharacterized protein n=1 Tax=Rangifer tarandus platyrhynchus TaxID=3082113 RepID=A0ABN8ZRI5_RANTA|nr:unnamed protein product [Rangifer tarandus platyrhynchus]
MPISALQLHICMRILFLYPFSLRFTTDVEYSSLCYIVGACFSSILNVIVCIPIPDSQSIPLPPLSPSLCNQRAVFYSMDKTEDLSPSGNVSASQITWKNCSKDARVESGYIGVLATGTR